ncbi:type VII secretion protein EccB [Micromonospora sp. DT233]|uniref:type VII secretion protein EccB n=1 Tax=Micromonospora sp. DT233 TaxID=3393432 RepID=UPI003CEC7291
MASRRDQVDAQRHMMARVTGALVRAEPETSESPTRRDRTGAFAGAMLGVLLVAGIAIWAIFPGSSGSTRWQQSGVLVVDGSTGARYVLADGRLRPVNDLATAALLAGSRLTPTTVDADQLAKLPRGAAVGTPAGPQVLPPRRINQGVWRACDQGAAGTVVDVDVPAAGAPLEPGQALAVSAGGRTHLLWGGRRLLLGEPWVADVLGLGLAVPVPVAQSWLNLIPSGGTAGPAVVPGAGKAGSPVAGRPTSVGDLFRVDLGNGGVGHYLMTTDGLAALTATEYLLERARPKSAGETVISPADLAAATRRTPARPLTTLPANPPTARPMPAGASVCVEFTGRPDQGPMVVLAAAPPAPVPSPAAPSPDAAGKTKPGAATKPRVTVRVAPGGGALLRPPGEIPAWPAKPPPNTLVDERGIAYQIAVDDLRSLGYAPEQAVVMPPALVGLLPTGPALVRPGGG